MATKKYSLSFNNIIDLEMQVMKIKEFTSNELESRKGIYKDNGIPFTEIDEYGVAINLSELTDPQKIILNETRTRQDEFYLKYAGVTIN